jgi:hypothetical protein
MYGQGNVTVIRFAACKERITTGLLALRDHAITARGIRLRGFYLLDVNPVSSVDC